MPRARAVFRLMMRSRRAGCSDREIARLLPLNDAFHVARRLAYERLHVRAIRHEPACNHEVAPTVHRWQAVTCRLFEEGLC